MALRNTFLIDPTGKIVQVWTKVSPVSYTHLDVYKRQPLAWWLERHLSALAEEACDAAVLARGHDPYEYSGYLLELARSVGRMRCV